MKRSDAKRYDVCGLGNAILDILVSISDQEFADLRLEKSTMRLVDPEEQRKLIKPFESRDLALVGGGSVANSIVAGAQLGARTAFLSLVGDDRYGLFYKGECDALKVDFVNPPIVGAMTGTCLSLVTPDAERTMRTCLAVMNELAEKHIHEETIALSHWLFIEGYPFSNPGDAQKAIRKAIDCAKRHGCKVALTCSEAWVVNSFSEPFRDAAAKADLIFANESEAEALSGVKGGEAAFAKLADQFPGIVVTLGPKGALASYEGQRVQVEAFPCEPKDLTGAGDMFAGAFLYGITHGVPLAKTLRAACFLAREVITRMGARLPTGTKDYWDDCLSQP